MMRTLCVAVVLLHLTSVGQPATLACEKLLKPADNTPALSGSWYIIAISTESCLVSALLNSVFWPSVKVDITPESTAKLYNANFNIKLYGHCGNFSEELWHEKNTMFEVDSNNTPTGTPDVLLQNTCPDCMSIKGHDKEILSTLLLLSRRKSISVAELKEFELQAECLSWSKPLVLNSDHDYENCPALDDDNIVSTVSLSIFRRLAATYTVPLSCLAEALFYHPTRVYKWVQQNWNFFW